MDGVRWLAIAIAIAWSAPVQADDAPSAYRCGTGGKPIPGKGCECSGGYVATRDVGNVAVCKPKPVQRPKTAKLDFQGDTLHGAVIAIDGIARGTAPQTIEIAPGRHLIEITREGYRPFTHWVEVPAGVTELIAPELIAIEKTVPPTPPPPTDPKTPPADPPSQPPSDPISSPTREPPLGATQTSQPVARGRAVRVELELGANTTAPLGVSPNGVARSEFATSSGLIGMRAAAAFEFARHFGVRASIHFVAGRDNAATAIDAALEIEARAAPTQHLELFAGIGPSYGAADVNAMPSLHLSGFGLQARVGAGVRVGAYGLALVITTTADDIPGTTFGWLTFCLAGSYRFSI